MPDAPGKPPAGDTGFRAGAGSNAPRVGLLVLDSEGGIILFNAAAEQILGHRALEVRGKPGEKVIDGLTDLLLRAAPPICKSAESPRAACGPGSYLPGAGGPGRPLLTENRPSPSARPLVTSARHKDGRIIPLVVTPYAVAPHDSVGSGDGAILVFQDAQQLEKMENQLQHLDRLHSLDEFAAGIVHEIRNPLAGISINAQFIAEDVKKHCRRSCAKIGRSDRLQEEMQDILADVQRIEGIVKKVLDFAHPSRSQVRACPVEDIVKEVLRFSRMPLRRQGIRLVTDLGTPARVRVDVPQMEQVLFNIVRNACDAMPGGGELRVSTGREPAAGARGRTASGSSGKAKAVPPARPGLVSPGWKPGLGHGNGHVRVEVADTGRGIAEGDLERIFDPFFSMHPEGTGLGLAISRKIVGNHGGRIEVESEPGKGTKFAVVLPTV